MPISSIGYDREYALASIDKEPEEVTYADYERMVAESRFWFHGPLGFATVQQNANILVNQALYQGSTVPPPIQDLAAGHIIENLRTRKPR
ncbi:MAG TPA: hypothetical protein VHD37_01205 [Candidatus Paceibacterota bacterium]|nr:hypothetical protein [Candidatus Paceibacterota bacterium]